MTNGNKDVVLFGLKGDGKSHVLSCFHLNGGRSHFEALQKETTRVFRYPAIVN